MPSAPRAVRHRRGERASYRLLLALTCFAVLTAGCGNRLSHEEVLAQNVTHAGSGKSASSSQSTAAVEGTSTNEAGAASGAQAAGADTAAGSTASGGGTTAGGGQTSAVTSGGGTSQPGANGVTVVAGGTKAPLVIAMVGWLSGIGGQTSGYSRDVLVAWSKFVNARGGINGHPIQLYVADDGGNEARSVSIVRDFVENKHVVALVYYTGGSVLGVGNYVKSKNIPVIGGNIIEPAWTQNPMLFPTQAATEGHFWGAAKLAFDAGKRKIATVYCTEVAACQQSNDTFVKVAKDVGLQVVYQGRISFTQPDYTAECLQMRNAGAEVVVPITENSSTVRLAQSCGRQDYKPIYDLQAVNTGMAKIAQFDNAIGNLATFPWFLHSGFAGLDQYTQAIQAYAPTRLDDGVDVQSGAWMAGKVFEKAAANVSDKPTNQEILDGLWAMKGEALDGLLVGGSTRTFNRGQPTKETYCVYATRIQGGKWVAPRGMTPVCR